MHGCFLLWLQLSVVSTVAPELEFARGPAALELRLFFACKAIPCGYRLQTHNQGWDFVTLERISLSACDG